MSRTNPGWPAVLTAGPVTLRPPRHRDAGAWSRIRIANQHWLEKWEPTAAVPWNERNSRYDYHRNLMQLRAAARAGTMMPFLIWHEDRLAGQLNVANIVRGAFRSCAVGYWIDKDLAGRGIMPTAVALVIDHCLTDALLHRVEVNIRPENTPSLRVVEKLRLRREGLHARFLDIDGDWRDHLSYAITSEELATGTVLSRLPVLPVRSS
jgi:ribosomal-protein-alanine N-acetyltransferase